MLTLDNLTYLYHHQPMCFSLNVTAGERVAILGPSGAGKSTLLSLIAGFLPVNSGSLTVNGQELTHLHPSQRPVSMLFQENNLFPHLTAEQNIGLGLHPGLRLSESQREMRQQIACQMGLETLLTRLPGQLSGGQRQRVALARCLVRQQPLLLLDEPFSALDPALRKEMLLLVKSLCESRGITLLMVSHSLEDAQQIAGRSVIIVGGSVCWQGETRALIDGEVAEAEVLGIPRR